MRLDHEEKLFRFAEGGVRCDEKGFRVGDVALLERGVGGSWRMRDSDELSRELSGVYGFPVDAAKRQAGFASVATALADGDVAKAQVAALLLRLPDPPSVIDLRSRSSERERLADDLAVCGLLRADADWDAQHPRTGTAPNPGWFANKPSADGADAEQSSDDSASPRHAPPRAIDIAYNSGFHDQLQGKILDDLNAAGNKCFDEVNLNFNGVNTFIDILCKNSVGELVGIEIKTGDTDYTENQKIVYPHAILGLGVVSSDMRIVQLGYQQWEPLPALDIQIIYSKTPGAPFTALSLRDLMFSKGV